MNSDTFKDEAARLSTKSTYKQPMGAVVVHKGRIVGRGFNKVHSTGIPRLDGKHAECEALNNTTAKYRKDSIVYVCRLTKNGNLAFAKPCHACYVVMKKMGVKCVWFSTSTEWIKMIL